MQIELCCPGCLRCSAAPTDAGAEALLDQMLVDAPGYALGDGETFEDMISTTLSEQSALPCPDCGTAMHFSEQSLGQLAMTMLTRM
jgi:hypothetical protein